MLFSSISFIYYFLPILLVVYYIVPKKFKNIILLIFSLLFYFWGEPKYLVVLLLEIIISFVGGLVIDKYRSKLFLGLFIVIHILILVLFKYLDFIIFNINSLFNVNLNYFKLILPIGISFYTFQIISYLIDVYNKRVEVNKNILNYATYVSLFPQLVAGPIVRYMDVNEDLNNRSASLSMFSDGIKLFIAGLAKKVILANNFGNLINIFYLSNNKTTLFYFLFAISCSLQLYYDFSGYSDMAIGLGKMFGFNFFKNFDYPFISKSISEFFRRWHISLGTWFRDYVYIPLGGNKLGLRRQIINIFIVFVLTGLWHGANYNFILWGLLLALLISFEKIIKNKIRFPNILKHIYTIFFILISFVIFSTDDLNILKDNLIGLFDFSNVSNSESIYFLKSYSILFIVGILLSTPILHKIIEKFDGKILFDIIYVIGLFVLFIISTAYLVDSSYNPFLYFRF